MKRILLVDDQAIVCYGTIQLLKENYPRAEVTSAKDVNEMVAHLNDQNFDLIILDINVPGGSNFGMLDIIRLRQPQIKILIFSGYDPRIYGQRYLDAGAHGFLSKQAPEKELAKAIDTVLNGGIYIPIQLKDILNEDVSPKARTSGNPLELLSNREIEVMNLLSEGLSPLEISVRLNLQLSTVSTYKHRIFEKLNVNNVIDLVQKTRLYSSAPKDE